jgi:hypothetical protein
VRGVLRRRQGVTPTRRAGLPYEGSVLRTCQVYCSPVADAVKKYKYESSAYSMSVGTGRVQTFAHNPEQSAADGGGGGGQPAQLRRVHSRIRESIGVSGSNLHSARH